MLCKLLKNAPPSPPPPLKPSHISHPLSWKELYCVLPLTHSLIFSISKDIYGRIQISNLSGLSSHTELLNERPSHIQICPPSRNEDMRISLGYGDPWLSILTAPTMAAVWLWLFSLYLCKCLFGYYRFHCDCFFFFSLFFLKIWLKSR